MKRRYGQNIDPDEIFLDVRNSPDFNEQQFEGHIEKAISVKTIKFFSYFCVAVFALLVWKTASLQIVQGEELYSKSLENKLDRTPVIAERGVIYDRNGIELAWNSEYQEDKDILKRSYTKNPGLSHVLGYVNYPKKDESGIFWRTEYIGRSGAELTYNDILSGKNGVKYFETNAKGEIVSSGGVTLSVPGSNIYLSVDQKVSSAIYQAIEEVSLDIGYRGGAGVIMDVKTGEIIALTNYPEYSSEVLSTGTDKETIEGYSKNIGKPYMNKVVLGRYTPGSIVKPFVALAALAEGVIDPLKSIYSSGSISIPNPYYPELKSTFYDWKAHGYVDMREAIAVSSDVYFYEISGGFEDQKGIGIANIDKYSKLFAIGEPTGINVPEEADGVIPTPEWKSKVFKGDVWRVGDTYNTSIGQYGYQVTPIQMVRAVSALANKGDLIVPTLVKDEVGEKTKIENFSEEMYKIVHEGMRMTVTEGTAQILNTGAVNIAAKTGTAQVGISKSRINSWSVGFFPYEKPQYAFAILLESGPAENGVSASFAFRKAIDKLNLEYPEFFESILAKSL
jgi:penicillin-binding protein 2